LSSVARDHEIERRLAQQRLLALIEHGEMRRHLGFEREALQQPFAEAVNGVDLEPASGSKCAGEQSSCIAEIVLFGGAPQQCR